MIQPGIIAAQSAGARPTVVREYYAAEQLGVIAATSTTFQNSVTLSIDPNAGEYLLVWSCDLQVSIITFNQALARLSAGGAELARAAAGAALTDDTTGWSTQGGVIHWTSDGSPTALTLDIAAANDVFAATGRIRNARVIALKLAADDEYAVNLGSQTTTLTSFTDACTLGFTPDEAGDYLILAFAEISGVGGDIAGARLYDGVNGTEPLALTFNNGERLAVVATWVKRGLSASQSLRLQYRASSSGNIVTVRTAQVFALRMDGFTHAYVAELPADSTGGETSYTAGLSLTRNVKDRDYLMLAAWSLEGTSSADPTSSRVSDDAVVVCETVMHTRTGNANPHFCGRLAAWTEGRRSFEIERKAPDPGTPTATIAEPSLVALLQLN